VHSQLALIVKVGKYPPVLPQKGMNIPDKAVTVFVKPVIVVVSALIGTEFLVGPAPKDIATIETSSIHDAKVFIKI
jgi:hypothetical protein